MLPTQDQQKLCECLTEFSSTYIFALIILAMLGSVNSPQLFFRQIVHHMKYPSTLPLIIISHRMAVFIFPENYNNAHICSCVIFTQC